MSQRTIVSIVAKMVDLDTSCETWVAIDMIPRSDMTHTIIINI
jgi:hypothetical protein